MPKVNYETLFPAYKYVGVPLNAPAFGTDDDPDTLFAIYDHTRGSRVYYQRASLTG